MAGFQVITYGRFWVFTEALLSYLPPNKALQLTAPRLGAIDPW